MSCTQAVLAVVVMMLEPLLAPFLEESIEEEMVSFHNFRNLSEIDLSSQPQASTSGARTCDRCYRHGLVCEWPGPKDQSKSCTFCKNWKSVCAILGNPVSNQKPWGKSEKVRAKKWKRGEVDSDVEFGSEGSGEDGWRAWGVQDVTFALLGIQERQDERNALLREQCGFQEQIACCLERMEARMAGADLDSTIRE